MCPREVPCLWRGASVPGADTEEQKSFMQDDAQLSPALAGLILSLLPAAHMGSGESGLQMVVALQHAHFCWLGER